MPRVVDWAAVRRLAAYTVRRSIGDQPVINGNSPALRVALLQQALNVATGAGLEIDGKWGPATDASLRNFQKFFGLQVDGVFGARSRFVMAVVLDKIAAGQA